jgi:ribose/xylose/arabinose/galactoside ABC-type transport system permease subunit
MKGSNTFFNKFKRFIKSNFNLVIITILVVFFTVFCGSRFFSFDNFITIARQAAILGMCGCGMMVLMLTGNVDMSLGGVICLVAHFYLKKLYYF